MSNGDGAFASSPVLTVSFTENHTSLGVTLYFDEINGDYCPSVNIKWYDGSGALMDDMDFTPDGPVYFCENTVGDYRKIVVTFAGTNTPYRYLKLSNILFGAVIIFGSGDLISANVLEEVDPLSSEISINTLDFKAYANDDRFAILNPEGAYSALQQKQPLTVRQTVGGVKKADGRLLPRRMGKRNGGYGDDQRDRPDRHNR